MAIKKSELYSSLWKSCDELRGGMDASQYKDYVLVMLFVKYVSDKYADDPYAPITVPKGAGFSDMVRLKGKPTIGDDINKRILGPIGEANKISDFPDFNDVNRLGSGKEMVTRLTNLIAIFENPGLDFSKNRVEGDDLLGDAYEYLMRNFATESGKSKGQFYTPAEVSRIMAKIIGIDSKRTSSDTTVYDPTCGSGSLLLKVGAESDKQISLFGQEMDVATASLARMNMILHNNPTADIKQGNTLANPRFLDNAGKLKTFDFAVANPPFSFKSWGNGVDPVNDAGYEHRWQGDIGQIGLHVCIRRLGMPEPRQRDRPQGDDGEDGQNEYLSRAGHPLTFHNERAIHARVSTAAAANIAVESICSSFLGCKGGIARTQCGRNDIYAKFIHCQLVFAAPVAVVRIIQAGQPNGYRLAHFYPDLVLIEAIHGGLNIDHVAGHWGWAGWEQCPH